ncbi:acetylxylan esterase [Aliifodinibius sp. S!AR15-10]|uniref:alpha/beta hydrolase family protein n=1 Tax=Aliifodinibius sp. S!AR15-10 TaxID=2950437 RepID=UPI00285889D5|nr:alpha/beta hydrolase family protein [Aliifodinibius sp. S!AR15-10]MDR8393341.1 acetylxylan esterase [Aliifodinibius sp. S!AR15-10]
MIRYTVWISLMLLLPVLGYTQVNTEVLGWQSELTWHKHLIQQMHWQYDQREEEIKEAFSSEKEAKAYQREIRNRYQDILGSFPGTSPLNAQVAGTIQQEGYHIEKIVYESFSNHHVTANLYVPEGEGQFPGVLLFCGHEREAKATPSYQRTAIQLARHGFVTLVIDPISQAERFQLTDKNGKPLTRGGTTEHTLLNAGSNLVGTNVMNYQYWDNKRGLDYLVTRPEVDSTRIAAIGNSGGGTMTTYFTSLNKKVKAAAVASFYTTRKRSLEILGPQDGCQWIPFEGRERLEINDFLLMNAPIPILALAGKYDFFDYVGTHNAFEEIEKFHSILEQPDKVKLFSRADGHGISKPKREVAVEWFNHWFYDDSSNVEEGEIPVLSEDQLQVTETGQVNSSFEDEYTIQQRNLDLAKEMESQREAFQQTHGPVEIKEKLRSLLGFQRNNNPVQPEFGGSLQQDGYHWEKVILRKDGRLPVPALVLYPPEKKVSGKTILWFSEEGKGSIVEDASRWRAEADSGHAIILADQRGMGETEDPARFNDDKYYDSQYRNDMISLHIGKPVVGQRTGDVMTVLDFVRQDEALDADQLEIHATGLAGAPALHAAVFDNGIDRLILSNTLRSYMQILETPTTKNSYGYVIPNALKYYDLPDLIEILGTGKVKYVSNGIQ